MNKYLVFFPYCVLCMLVSCLYGCGEDVPYLGQLKTFNSVDDEVMVKADSVVLARPHSCWFAVYDTLSVFYIQGGTACFYEIYNTRTGGLIGEFLPRGQGHGEFMCLDMIPEIYNRNGQLTAYVSAPTERKMVNWNISQSVLQHKTVYTDSPLKDDEYGISHERCSEIGKDSMLVYRHSETVRVNGQPHVVEPVWKILDRPTGKLLDELREFRLPEAKEDTQVRPERFFTGFSCVKPDRSRLVEAMCCLPQISITDLKHGKMSGYLMKGHDDYSLFSTDMQDARYYYVGVQSNDRYIFALWCGEKMSELSAVGYDEVHVFDWDGRMLKKVKLSVPVQSIYLDQANDLLYGCHQDRQPLYRYKVADMGL